MFWQLTDRQPIRSIKHVVLRYPIAVIVGTLAVLLVIGLGLRYFKPTPTTPPSLTNQGNPDGSQTQFLNLTFSGTAPTIPEKMWLADVTQFDQTNSQQLLEDLIKSYQLEPSSYVANVWNGPDYSLEYDPNINEYRLSRSLAYNTLVQTPITQSSIAHLVNKAETHVKRIFPDNDFSSFPKHIELLEGGGEFSPATTENATHLKVPFGQSFYGVPVWLEYEREFPLVTYLDSNGALIKLVARPFTAQFQATTQHDTLAVEEAIQQIEQGNASIIDSYSEQTVTPDLTKVVRGDFDSVALQYRIDPTTNNLVPYYHFSGTLVNNDNDIFSAEVITPAVRLDR